MSASRENLLFSAFTALPLEIGNFQLRPMSPGSYSLLQEIGCALLGTGSANPTSEEVMAAVHEYIWIHSADLEEVLEITSRADLPAKEIRKIGFDLTMAEAMGFLDTFAQITSRMAASMAEPVDEDTAGGKPVNVETFPTSSPPSSSPSVQPETPSASDTSPGTPPSSAPSNTSTPPTPTTEQPAAGPSTSPETPQPLPIFTPPLPPSASAT